MFQKGDDRMISFIKKNKIIEVITLIIAIVALCLSIATLTLVNKHESDENTDIQYVIYLGTNDKDTNQPIFSPDEAKAKAEEILLEHFGGYTIQEATGGWDDNGTVYREYTLAIYVSDTTIDKVHAAADEMLRVFNQKSVLIQSNETKTEFYYSN
jgi:hypothetical protein